MKKLVFLIITLVISSQTIKAQTVVLDANGVTVKWTGTTVPSPYFVQANPRGTGMEWFAIVDNSTKNNITDYARNIQLGISYFTPPSESIPIPFNNIITTLITNMQSLLSSTDTFNQPIESWDVSNVTYMREMFSLATVFNQPIGSWDVSNVTDMSNMFELDYAFNQPIGSWNVSNVTTMGDMFMEATSFNQPIGSWNVGNVIYMGNMFREATAFNQPIGTWNVGNVFQMGSMFYKATSFNQNIGFWNVGKVWGMYDMFLYAGLSMDNYDALLIGWSTISSNETPLTPNVVFTGGNSKYCNGASARSSIISTYGWTITDGGLDCSLDTEELDVNSLILYPNPVIGYLNVKVDYDLINQRYMIVDGIGRVVLIGKINEVDTNIYVEQLSKGVYFIKIADNKAIKFIKE